MLEWFLGSLGLGVGGLLVLGLLLRFGLLSWLPGAVVNFIGMGVELVFRGVGLFFGTLLDGLSKIFQTWQAGFALVCCIIAAMIAGPAPLKALLTWKPSAPVMRAVEAPDAPEKKPVLESIEDNFKAVGASLKKKFVPAQQPRRPVDDSSSILRNQLRLPGA